MLTHHTIVSLFKMTYVSMVLNGVKQYLIKHQKHSKYK